MNKNKRIAILLILASAISFSGMNLFVRLAGDIPSIQKSFFRNAVAFFCALFVVAKSKTSLKPPKGSTGFLALRSIFGTVGIFCNFYAVDHLNISDASMLNKLSPFFAILLSAIILKEKVSLKQAFSVLLAFCGLLLIVRPGFNNISLIPYLIGMTGGIGAGCAYTMVRKLGAFHTPSALIVFYFSLFSSVAAIPFFITNPAPMSGKQLILLLCAGTCASAAQFSITNAYKYAAAREISIFEYTQIIFSAILGFFVLGQVPDALCFLGYLIIIGAAAFNTLSSKKA